ncbi:hypothetical protein LOK49_LG14G01802 [Camellia lanceoleosa]|uniref:Uncharacterized protein n=1 Tax=Camellia lanceoleosa TaxID=1840588 RepID=A0ACC0F967_9ERIC|nr:hypothetical protein LOK49_LG14G01802 [Camellia lanceoleosa]
MEIQEPQNSTRTLEKASPINGNSVKHENEDTDSFRSDAEPFHGRWYEKEGSDLVKNKELVTRDHKLELCAYCNALKALFASGPLSWEDEMEVTDLRLSLHILDDEHLVELRNLIFKKGWTIILTSLGAIATPKMLNDGAVEYEDGTPTTVTGNLPNPVFVV